MKRISAITQVQNEKGLTLVNSVVMVLVISLFGGYFLTFGSMDAEAVRQRSDRLSALWKAEEALSRARVEIQNLPTPHGCQGETITDANGLFARYTFEQDSAASSETVIIRATVYHVDNPGNPLFTLLEKEKAELASKYFMMFDQPGQAYFTTGDVIDGDIHTNSYFKITGSPVFRGATTYSGLDPGFEARPMAKYQEPDKLTRVDPYLFTRMSEKIRKTTHTINVPVYKIAHIDFNPDGTYDLRYRDVNNPLMMTPPIRIKLPSGENYGIFVNGDVEVQGRVKGKVTVGASGDIHITHHLTYMDSDPQTGAPAQGSTNILGLIAEHNVLVNQDQIGTEVGKGIRINAAIIAMNKSFEVINYMKSRKTMGVMNFWGCIIQYERGPIGSYRRLGNITRGYTKNWHYDNRLGKSDVNPPFFPPLLKKNGSQEYKPIYWERGIAESVPQT